MSGQNTTTSEPTPQPGLPDKDSMATSAVQEASQVKRGRRSRKGSSAGSDAEQAQTRFLQAVDFTIQVAGTDKAAVLNRPESELSTTSTVQEPTAVKKDRRSKRRRSISSASQEAPKPEVIQQPLSTPLESGASSSTPFPPEPTLGKDGMEADEMATKEAVQGEAAAPAMPNEALHINPFQPLREGKASKGPPLRSTGYRDDPKTSNLADNRRRLFVAAVLSVFILNALAVLWLLMRTWDNEEMQIEVPGLGTFRGLRFSIENRPVYMFRAIPFARSPEGPLRFADASVVSADNRAEIDARTPKPGCAQKAYTARGQIIRSNEDTTEDCLHLNVWTPCTEHTSPGCRRTVLVFFHAIEFQNGDNNYYDGRWLAGLGELVVVAPNFRLGAFGFLNIGCLVGGDIPCTPGHVALGDQRMAVQWVLDHIASFGGNASDVVLMGSGSGAWYFDDKSHELPALLNCSRGGTVEVLHCMRVVPSREIVRVTSEMVRFFGPSASALPGVKDALRVAGRRFLLGTVSSEGTHLFDYLKRTSSPEGEVDSVVSTFLNVIYHIKNAREVVDAFRRATTSSDNGN
ncbi:hypothetical protein HPB49_002393 [Dermacentor silvarum]|uniref:Uncharacterized protein n=1 Tax=Dermacentor silvarum TaxID=543639 RepID=A0ACB8C1D3_DERSI|nr:hypothetical protein HPB49_002393 [Dermacentor silvarum]